MPNCRAEATAFAVLMLALPWLGMAAEAEGGRIEAASEALEAGRAEQVLRLFGGTVPDDLDERWVYAQALVQVRGLPEAEAVLGLPDRSAPLDRCAAWLADWPVRQRSRVAATIGRWRLTVDPSDPSGPRWLGLAIEVGGPGSDDPVNRLYLADALARQGRRALARQAAEPLWRHHRGTSAGRRAGELFAYLVEADRGWQIRAELLKDPALDGPARLRLLKLIERGVLEAAPDRCLRLARLAGPQGRSLAALALVRLDPLRGLAELANIPPWDRLFPQAVRAIDGASTQLRADQDPEGLRRNRARAALALEEFAQAEALLRPVANHDPEALLLLAQVPGAELVGFLAGPAILHPDASAAVLRRLSADGEARRVWDLSQRLLEGADERVLVLDFAQRSGAQQAGAQVGAQQLSRIEGLLRSRPERHRAVGEAWARFAQTGGGAQAWLETLEHLPTGHPWVEPAARFLAQQLADTAPGLSLSRDDPQREGARALAEALAAHLADADERLLWLAFRAQAQAGDPEAAGATLDRLAARPLSDERRHRLNLARQRLGGTAAEATAP